MDEQSTEIRDLILGMGDRIDQRLNKFDERFDGIDQRLNKFDGRFDEIDQRLNKIDGRFDGIDQRLNKFDGRFDEIDERDRLLREYMDERFAQVELRFTQMHEYTNERSHDIETRLLTEFHKWAVRIESTIKPLPFRMGGHEERIAMIEERLRDLDKPLF